MLLWALTSTFSHLFGAELKTQPLSNCMENVGYYEMGGALER